MERFLTPYDLSNSGQEKLQFTPFGGGPKPVCSDDLRAGTMESRTALERFHLRRLNREFQQDCPKDKNYSSFNSLVENLEKFRSTEHYGAALEGSTVFLCRSSLGCTSMENCQLADLKHAISAAQDVILKYYHARSSFY